jgi:hypothetical protein
MANDIRFAALVILAHPAAVAPATDTVDRARRAFSALGFEVGGCVGDSFSIEGIDDAFHAVFGVRLHCRPDGAVTIGDGSRQSSQDGLPLAPLPATLRPLVSAVVFSDPPAFGPGTMP